MELHAAGILAGLAAAVFAAQCAGGRAVPVALLGFFAGAAFVFARLGALDVTTLGFCVCAAAVTALTRPQWRLLPPLAAGIFAAAWISILQAQGLPWLPAAVVAAFVTTAAAALAALRHGFVTTELRDEALVIVASFALLLGVGPGVVEGWRSSVALKSEPLASAGPQIEPWLGALVIVTALLGGAYTIWKRR